MWFKRLRIVNVGPFADLTLDFTRGSIGIFGKNGTGKSTLLNCCYGLITNDFTRFDGVKTDMIRTLADSKEESYIEGTIEHNDNTLYITRNFKPTKSRPGSSVRFNKEDPIFNADKGQELLDSKLGVDKKLLDLYVFKTQDRIYDFITSIPSERAKAYQTLCRTEDCEVIWNTFGEFLNKDKDINIEIADNSDELQASISEAEESLKKIEEQKTQAVDKLCSDKFKTKYENVIRAQQRLEDYREKETTAKARVPVAQAALKAANAALEEVVDRNSTLGEKVNKRKSKADDTRAALTAWAAYAKYRSQRKTLKEEAESLEAEQSKNKPPEAPADSIDKLDGLNKQLVLWEAELDKAKKVVEVFNKTGRTECPTCATSVTHLADHLKAMKDVIKDVPPKVKSVEDRVEAIDTYKSESRKYEKWKTGYDARLAANTKAREALKDITAPDGDKDELKKWLLDFEELEKKFKDSQADRVAKEKAVSSAELQLEAAKDRVAEIAQGIADNTEEPSVVEKAKRRLAEHEVAANTVAELTGEAKGVQHVLDEKQAELKKLKSKLKRNRKIKQMATVIRMAREIMHRDRLPRRVAIMNLTAMEGDVNEGLAHFGDPYWVEANSELSFTVHKPGEPPQAAGRLSTGQRVVLAMSFWPAVASLWSSDLGMLALDEPTANLDADNRKFLAQALGAMTAKVRGQRQLIMVTHDPDLRTSFDQIIDLGG